MHSNDSGIWSPGEYSDVHDTDGAGHSNMTSNGGGNGNFNSKGGDGKEIGTGRNGDKHGDGENDDESGDTDAHTTDIVVDVGGTGGGTHGDDSGNLGTGESVVEDSINSGEYGEEQSNANGNINAGNTKVIGGNGDDGFDDVLATLPSRATCCATFSVVVCRCGPVGPPVARAIQAVHMVLLIEATPSVFASEFMAPVMA